MKIRSMGEATPKIPRVSVPAPQMKVAPTKDPAERSPFQRLVEGLGKEINSGEHMMKTALSSGGGSMEPGQLLALQAGVYRYSEAVDLASKLIDRTSSGVKTVINGGGQ
jgi:hypothetical protein